MCNKEILATNLSISGYGMNKEEVLEILNKLNNEEIEDLTYNMYRTSEKLGMNAFKCDEVFDW